MSANDDLKKAMQELKDASAAVQKQHQEDLQQHRADAKTLADMTTKLNGAIQGQTTDVDIPSLVTQIHQAAMDLSNGILDTHTESSDVKTANQDQSVVQGGSTTGPDVVSASSIGTIVPEGGDAKPNPNEPSLAVPSSLGGGAMPVTEITSGSTAEKEPGADLPPSKPEEVSKPAEPAVPSIEDIPSNISDTAPESTKKD